MGARATRVVHLGTDLPVEPRRPPPPPTLVTVAHLAARKRHADVLEAVARLAGRYPSLRYLIVGDGPERESLRARAAALGLADRVELRGQVDPDRARAVAQQASLFVMPSVHEAFGVAYIEAMAAGVPAIGCQGEDGPQEIAEAGPGIRLVPPRDPVVLAEAIDALLSRPHMLEELGREARETVRAHFTWEQCGRDTVDAYRSLLS
jgi:glycosyltransferase involved in cell wall biosynthesis